ncbi:hypothetical protein ITP53_54490 [Nonomuraea sp. K274]|uniref:Uncharacterized protein n=1 Tax=Nonomuraea cypriaca TaxID=1187855 RepID=A0A931APT7_9ACTN|nr:hypothetical protein [Nonomuraea cypriaca]MBF8194523.1 hypothetical protein [Nonomuraea cypriaca]
MHILNKTAAVLVVLIAAGTPMVADAQAAPARAAGAQAKSAYVAYHDISSAQHAERSTTLRAQGFTLGTLSVSAGPRYAAVWVKGRADSPWVIPPGPYQALHQDMSDKEYQRRFVHYTAHGYQPKVVTATGSGASATFAALFVKARGAFEVRHGLRPNQLSVRNIRARAKGMWPTSIDVYGSAADPLYVAVWSVNPNPKGRIWKLTTDMTPTQYNAEFQRRVDSGFRLTSIAVSPWGTYTAVWFTDDSLATTSWHSYSGMSAAGYQKRFNELKAKGFYPSQVNSENGIYAAVWDVWR